MKIYFTILFIWFVYALGGYLFACLEEYESKIKNKR